MAKAANVRSSDGRRPGGGGRTASVSAPSPAADTDRTWTAVLIEYERTQVSIARFDDHRQRARAWLVSLLTATAAISIQQAEPVLSLLAPVVAMVFFLLEMIYMSQEELLIEHSNQLESTIDTLRTTPGAEVAGYQFGFGRVFVRHRFRPLAIWRLIADREHVTWFYGGVVVAMVTFVVLAFTTS
ncbi:MAG: hypothetical protein WAS51_07120 [Ilumatobacteraceae bacterium]